MFSPFLEIEFARTALAMGRPVDVQRLIDVAEEAICLVEDGEPTEEAMADALKAEGAAREAKDRAAAAEDRLWQLANAIRSAVAELRKDRLTATDRRRTANILEGCVRRVCPQFAT